MVPRKSLLFASLSFFYFKDPSVTINESEESNPIGETDQDSINSSKNEDCPAASTSYHASQNSHDEEAAGEENTITNKVRLS